MATAELALAMPALIMVLAVSLFAFGCAYDELRCVDAARAGARAAARGDVGAEVRSVAARMAPAGSQVELLLTSDTATVTVSAPTRFSAVLSSAIHLGATAAAARETEGGP